MIKIWSIYRVGELMLTHVWMFKNNITILSSDITKLKELIYEKYNNDKYHLIRNISQKTKVNFDIVHIICNKLNVKENNINKGIINEIMDSINKYINFKIIYDLKMINHKDHYNHRRKR